MPTPVLIAIITLYVLMAGAVTLLVLSLRGKLVPIPPRCARCAHLVDGPAALERGVCPECGADLRGPDAIRFFRPRRRVLPFVAAFIMVIATMLVPRAIAMLAMRRQPAVSAAMTTPQVLATLSDPDAYPDLVYIELGRRVNTEGGMSDEDVRLAMSLIATQPSARSPSWVSNELAAFIAAADLRKLLTKEDFIAIARRSSGDPPSLRIPPHARRGAQLIPIFLVNQQRGLLSTRGVIHSVSLDGSALAITDPSGARLDRIEWTAPGMVTLDAAPGQHEIVARGEIIYSLGSFTATEPLELRTSTEIVAADAPSWIVMESPPSARTTVRSRCEIEAVSLDRDSRDGACLLRTEINLGTAPQLALAFRVKVVIGGTEYPGSTMMASGSSTSQTWNVSRIPCPDPIPDTVTVIFSPDPSPCETDPEYQRIWGEPVIFENVPLRHSAPKPAGTP